MATNLPDGILAILAAALACHLIFNRYEPVNPLSHLALLVTPPLALSPVLRPAFSSSTSHTIVAIFTLYYSFLLLSVVAYRLSPLHPLARYPGPIPCRISKFWMAWISTDGKQHEYYTRLHQKYGDVVRIGPNELSFRDVDAIDPLMGYNGLPKGPHWDGRMAEQTTVRALISIRDPHEHMRRRKPWNRAFRIATMKGYEEILANRTHEFVSQLQRQSGPGHVNLTEWISRFTFDFMSDMAFGGGSDMLRDGDKDNTWHLLESGLPLALVLSHVPWLGKYYTSLPGIEDDLKKFRSYCQARALHRRTQGSQTKDLFHYLIDEEGIERNPPTFAEVASDGVLAIVAGSDTTATTLVCLFYSLMANKTAYRRLRDEVDKYYPPGEDASATTHHGEMKYLRAVINEALRLYPPVLSGSQRAVPKGSGGKQVGPHFLPEGTSAFVHFYSIHRDPRYFSPSPDAFWPERWLSAEDHQTYGYSYPKPSFPSDKSTKAPYFIHNPSAFIPFSYGPMNCVGKRLALQEMRTLVCCVMQKFDLRFVEGYDVGRWERELSDYFVAVRGELPVVVSPRAQRDGFWSSDGQRGHVSSAGSDMGVRR
ncbi:cytochrome P450 [Pisolithus marmoratus]|nr:cytochrome P450 [Pisolithus marmoratus]KAI6038776.1 cytochrome P450 [Pisolithus marmoratus]